MAPHTHWAGVPLRPATFQVQRGGCWPASGAASVGNIHVLMPSKLILYISRKAIITALA